MMNSFNVGDGGGVTGNSEFLNVITPWLVTSYLKGLAERKTVAQSRPSITFLSYKKILSLN